MKTILVIYTNTVITTAKDLRSKKKYSFNTESSVKVGDLIQSQSYGTNMQIVKVLDKLFKYYNSNTGELSDEFTSTMQNESAILVIRENNDDVVYGSIINKED